ncbi:DNA repair exonuclease [Bacteroides sp. 519]|uniref:metallophosphoesterase family protein n=1 Tax=Bacteroides sp. 519 TaxID=2302937 RepID=UPI0019402BAF|nr:DNA repair exonuclease [Bacteroides sp. 519]NDV58437.1 DNA repair exonuclease [Bacteroides sp. 519]
MIEQKYKHSQNYSTPMAIKIVVTGDLHLGKRSSLLTDGNNTTSTKYTWGNIVQYVIDQQIDLLLLTGDIVDRDNRFYEAIGPLQTGFDKLSQAGIPVYLVAGNHDHDVLPQIITINNLSDVHLLGRDGKWESQIHSTPNGESVRIAGWSFTNKYIYESAINNTFPQFEDSIPTLALLHGDAYQAISKYNPVNIEKMKQYRAVDAWLLGHIHKADVICEKTPLILYPGSPHALNPKEKEIHGPWLLTIENKEITYKHLPLSPVCYQYLNIDVSTAINEIEFRKQVIAAFDMHLLQIKEQYNPHFLVYDIEFTGTHNNVYELRKWSDEIKNYNPDDWCHVSIRSMEYNIRPELDINQLMNEPSYIGVLATAIKTLETGSSNGFIDKLVADWKSRYEHLTTMPVYIPLKAQKPDKELDKMAREYVLNECRELIAELNHQRNEN